MTSSGSMSSALQASTQSTMDRFLVVATLPMTAGPRGDVQAPGAAAHRSQQ
jgi:hypothetical protein